MPELTIDKIITDKIIELGLEYGIIEFEFTNCNCKVTIGEYSFIIQNSDFADLPKEKIPYFLFAVEIRIELNLIKTLDKEKYLYFLNYLKDACESKNN